MCAKGVETRQVAVSVMECVVPGCVCLFVRGGVGAHAMSPVVCVVQLETVERSVAPSYVCGVHDREMAHGRNRRMCDSGLGTPYGQLL
jgi:hypothetical protein